MNADRIEIGDIVDVAEMGTFNYVSWPNCIVVATPYEMGKFWIVRNEAKTLIYFELTTVMLSLKAKSVA